MKNKTKLNVADDRRKVVGKTTALAGGQANPIVMAFAHRLSQWRRQQKKTVRQVASDLGMSGSIISEWENCQRYPSVNALQSVIEYTGISACEFFCPSEGDAAKRFGAKIKSPRNVKSRKG